VVNVYKYFKMQFSDKSDNYIVKETCNATCTSRVFLQNKKEAAQVPLRTQKKRQESNLPHQQIRKVQWIRPQCNQTQSEFVICT
jgi:hypothetical protein